MIEKVSRREVVQAGMAAPFLLGGISRAFAHGTSHEHFRNGLCATSFSDGVFEKKIAFRDGRRLAGDALALQKLMMARGSNEVFARLGSSRATTPRKPEGAMGAARRRAALARRVGLPLNPEFLLCANYGDMGGQPEPDFSGYPEIRLAKPWHELGIEAMCDAMRIYGRIVAREILETGVRVNVWDIGNEVEFGIAGVAIPPMNPRIGGLGWSYRAPDAVDPEIGKMSLGKFFMMKKADQVAWGKTHLWIHVGRIMAAVADGIREVDPAARFATHASAIAALMPEVFVGFHEAMDAAGFRAQECGVSYYPTDTKLITNRLARFKQTVLLTRQRLRRPVYIAEFGYAGGPVTYGGEDWANPVEGYPCTPVGQANFLRDLVAWGARDGLLSGIRPWAPDYVGEGWQGMALFDAPVDGVALARPGLAAVTEGLMQSRKRQVA